MLEMTMRIICGSFLKILTRKKKQQKRAPIPHLCNQLAYEQMKHNSYLKAPGLVLPSPRTRDSVISMLSERIIGTMCLNREEGDGMPII